MKYATDLCWFCGEKAVANAVIEPEVTFTRGPNRGYCKTHELLAGVCEVHKATIRRAQDLEDAREMVTRARRRKEPPEFVAKLEARVRALEHSTP